MASQDLVEFTADLTVETLAALRHVFADPRLAHSYFHVCGLPPLAIPPSFSSEVDALIANRGSRGAAATQREAGRILSGLATAPPGGGQSQSLVGGNGPSVAAKSAMAPEAAAPAPSAFDPTQFGTTPVEITHRLLLPVMLERLRKKWPKVYFGVATFLFLDEKVREWYPGHFGKHWAGAFSDFWKTYRSDPQVTAGLAWPLYVAHGALIGAVVTEYIAGEGVSNRFRFALGYDHPARDTHADVLQTLQRAVSASWRLFEDRTFLKTDYDAFGALYAEERHQIGFTIAPVPGQRSGDQLVRKAAMLLQLEYEHTDKAWDDWRWTIGGSGKSLYIRWPDIDLAGSPDMRASLKRLPTSEGYTLGSKSDSGTYGLTITGVEFGAYARRGIGAALFARLRGAKLEVKPPKDNKILGALLPNGFELPVNTGLRLDKDGFHWEGPEGGSPSENAETGGGTPAPSAKAGGPGAAMAMAAAPEAAAPRAIAAPPSSAVAASTPTSVSRALEIPINKMLGAGAYGLRLNQIRLVGTYRSRADGHDIEAAATASLTLALGPVTGTVEGIGAALVAKRSDDTAANNVAGLASLDWAFVPPTGIGVVVDAKVIKGGGFLRFDPPSKRYAGALELAIGKRFTLKGVGLVEPTASGKTSMILLATLELPPAGPGFSVTGVGAFLGLHRRGEVDEFRKALSSGDLADVLFPANPIARASQILSTLGRFFPSKDGRHVIGLLFQFVFGGQTKLITGSLGAMVEIGSSFSDTQVYLLLQAKLELPGPLKKLFQINVDGFGHWDVGRGEFELRLKLRDSKLFGAELTGEGLVLYYRVPGEQPALPAGDGDVFSDAHAGQKQLFLSLGGYHPLYRPPARARVEQRLGLLIKKGDWLRFEVQKYVALTPGAFHFGSDASLMLKFWKFTISGGFGYDALIGFDWSFDVGIHASLSVKYGSRTLTSVGVDMRLRGPGPTTISGTVTVSILWWDLSKDFHKELSSTPSAPQPAPDLVAMLETAVRQPDSWDRAPVDGIALAKRERAGRIWASPTRPLRMQQSVVPLGLAVERYGPSKLARATTFSIGTVKIGAAAQTPTPVNGEFARALYVDLSDEEKLAAEGFEDLRAGFEIDPEAFDIGPDRVSTAVFEDSQIPAPPQPQPRGPVGNRLLEAALVLSPLAVPTRAAPLITIAPKRFGVGGVDGVDAVWTSVPYILARQKAREQKAAGVAAAHVVRADEINGGSR